MSGKHARILASRIGAMLNGTGTRYAAIVIFLIACLQVLESTRLVVVSDIDPLITLAALFVLPLFIVVSERFVRSRAPYNHDHEQLATVLSQRRASIVSTQTTTTDSIEDACRVELLYRNDVLDYNTSDYVSVRQLSGRNLGRSVATSFLYSEATDFDIAFDDIQIDAIDTSSRKPLIIQGPKDSGEQCAKHEFRILFATPIERGQEFSIAFSIRVPGELSWVKRRTGGQLQTISMAHYARPVSKLTLCLSLNFVPLAARGFSVKSIDDARGFSSIELEHHSGFSCGTGIEGLLLNPLPNSVITYSMSIEHPRGLLYGVEYFR